MARPERVPPSTPEEIELARRDEYDYYPGASTPVGAPTSPLPSPATMQMSITVPDGTEAGQAIEFQTPDGRVFSAVVPAGTPPGGSFMIEVEAPAPKAEEDIFSAELPTPPAAAPKGTQSVGGASPV